MMERVTGMVLSVSPISEYDKRIVLLTKEYGKISAFARGARKQNSPLLACTEPFTFGEFSVFRGHNSFNINAVASPNYFSELRNDLESIYYAYYFCEMADYFTSENVDGTEVMKLLYQSFRALQLSSIKKELVRYIVELKMLTINGEAPRVFSCVKCEKKEHLHFFVIEEQGVYCDSCKMEVKKSTSNKKRGIVISETTVYTLQRIISTQSKSLFTFMVSDAILSELQVVMKEYFKNRTDKQFRSLEMIEKKFIEEF